MKEYEPVKSAKNNELRAGSNIHPVYVLQFGQVVPFLEQIIFMKPLLTAFLLLTCAQAIHAQYYYNDVIAAVQADKQYQSLKKNHIKEVNGSSFEADGNAAEGFLLSQQLTADYSKITTNAAYPSAGRSHTVHFYDHNQLTRTEDSSARVLTSTTYTYDEEQHLKLIRTTTDDPFMNSRSEEIHQWEYQTNGVPAGMLKITDGQDTTFVSFQYDDLGNISEEQWTRKGQILETYYYYYNDQKQVTDIVRFNARAKRLLPDFLFEYDAAGRISQTTQVTAGSSNYIVWKYVFNQQGLKVRDLCYNKQQQMVGRIEYAYVTQ